MGERWRPLGNSQSAEKACSAVAIAPCPRIARWARCSNRASVYGMPHSNRVRLAWCDKFRAMGATGWSLAQRYFPN